MTSLNLNVRRFRETLEAHNKRTQEAFSYNALVQSWPEMERLARDVPEVKAPKQGELLWKCGVE